MPNELPRLVSVGPRALGREVERQRCQPPRLRPHGTCALPLLHGLWAADGVPRAVAALYPEIELDLHYEVELMGGGAAFWRDGELVCYEDDWPY